MKKTHSSTVVLVLVFLVGLSLLLYPTVSDYWNSLHQTRAIASYAETVANIDSETYEMLLEEARKYNSALAETGIRWNLSEKDKEEYNSLLRVSGSAMIGYIEITSIDVYLPIYHGTDDSVLRLGVGHLEGTSLPVGGESTHAVISGHRGLPSAKLFTDLDKLNEGDTFILRILDETLTYEVDQILIVEPEDVSTLKIEEGKDYCTLVTCTPYGINTHRLLVRGHRIENEKAGSVRVTADAMQIETVLVAPIVAVPMLAVLLLVLLLKTRKKRGVGGIANADRKAKKRRRAKAKKS